MYFFIMYAHIWKNIFYDNGQLSSFYQTACAYKNKAYKQTFYLLSEFYAHKNRWVCFAQIKEVDIWQGPRRGPQRGHKNPKTHFILTSTRVIGRCHFCLVGAIEMKKKFVKSWNHYHMLCQLCNAF